MKQKGIRRTAGRALACVLLGLLVACAAEPPAPVAVEPVAGAPERRATARRTVPAPERPPDPGLCPRLAGLMAREDDGYASYRGRPAGPGRWHAPAALPGVERCTVEGEAWPRARVSCSSGRPAGREHILARFDDLASRIEACLSRGFWFPRDWQRGELFEFAMDERHLAWVDMSSKPPSTVVLKVHQDLVSRDYLLTMDVETIR